MVDFNGDENLELFEIFYNFLTIFELHFKNFSEFFALFMLRFCAITVAFSRNLVCNICVFLEVAQPIFPVYALNLKSIKNYFKKMALM